MGRKRLPMLRTGALSNRLLARKKLVAPPRGSYSFSTAVPRRKMATGGFFRSLGGQ